MIKNIRDDVIKLESYVVATFKYDELLTILCEVGGYCLLQQLKEQYGETKAKRIVKELEEYKLIGTDYYSNAKYIYVTQSSLKYLANKENISQVVNTKLKNIDKMPAEKVLIQSILKYQIETEIPEIPFVKRQLYIELLQEKLLKIKNIKFNSIDNIKESKKKYQNKKEDLMKFISLIENYDNNVNVKNIIQTSKNKYQENIIKFDETINYLEKEKQTIQKYIKQALKLFDLQKIIIMPEDEETLVMIIIDYAQVKPIKKYIEDIKNFEILIKKQFNTIKISYITYSKERHDKVIKRFKKYLADKKIMRIEFVEYDNCYKLQRLIERYYEDEKNIKKKDIKKYEKIKEQLKTND